MAYEVEDGLEPVGLNDEPASSDAPYLYGGRKDSALEPLHGLSTGSNTTDANTAATGDGPNADDVIGGKERESWGSKMQFLLATIGYAVGLGNVWRFPYLCYRNGGGAFLIPYLLSLVLIGIPLFLLELAIGQYHRRGAIGTWSKIAPALKGVGIASVVVSFVVSLYYNVIIGWSLFYFGVSMSDPLPWVNYTCNANDSSSPVCVESATENYFYREMLQASSWIDEPSNGDVVWEQAICLLVAWIITYLCIVNGVESSGKVAYFTATFPFVVLFILFFRGVTLPGAGEGVLYVSVGQQ